MEEKGACFRRKEAEGKRVKELNVKYQEQKWLIALRIWIE